MLAKLLSLMIEPNQIGVDDVRILINIDVPKLAPAIEFYSAAFGLTLHRVIGGDVAELVGASSTIYLLEKTGGSSVSATVSEEVRRYTRHWTPMHIDFVVDDVAESKMRALNAGATQESDCVDWQGSRCITFSDPFGHGFCLIEFSGESYQQDL